MRSISNKIRAGYPGIYFLCNEEPRAEATIAKIATDLNFNLFAWSIVDGRVDVFRGETHGEIDPAEVLGCIPHLPERSILLLRDFHLFLKESNPVIIRLLKNALLQAKASNKTLVILAPEIHLPIEITKLFTVEEFALPDREELGHLLANLSESIGVPHPPVAETEQVIDAALGLTVSEAEDALALSVIESSGQFDHNVVSREKSGAVKKTGLLEVYQSTVTLDAIGGLEVLKADLLERRAAFSRRARDYGLGSPRGILAVGAPGTGKSLTCQAAGNIFSIPLLKLDSGSLFGSLVGESERNWRTAFATAKAIAPCVLWIDEADGLFCGAKSSGSTDGGTTNRVVKAILQDMQFNSDGIFYCVTANDIDGFPDALIDRLDPWAVDLPHDVERRAIWSIQITDRRRDPAHFDLVALSAATDGFSGRQIREVWLKALNIAFNENEREPTTEDALAAAKMFVPTSITMAKALAERRARLSAFKPASAAPAPAPVQAGKTARKIHPQNPSNN
jgi:AAA+ superfamily predicted ATPase